MIGYHGYTILIFWIFGYLDIKHIISFWMLQGNLVNMYEYQFFTLNIQIMDSLSIGIQVFGYFLIHEK